MKLSLNSMTRLTKMQQQEESKFSLAIRHDTLLFTLWQAGYRRETKQADGKRLDVMPVGFTLQIVLLGSCSCDCCSNTVPAGSSWLCVCVWHLCTHVHYRIPAVSCYWICMYAVHRIWKGTRCGGMEGNRVDEWVGAEERYRVGEPDRIRSVCSPVCSRGWGLYNHGPYQTVETLKEGGGIASGHTVIQTVFSPDLHCPLVA